MIVLSIHEQEPIAWARRHFGEVDLGDLRRDQRAETIAIAMAANPGKSIPQLFAGSYDLKAASQFFKHEEATPDNLQAGHREIVLEEMKKPGRYLLLEDSSEMTWPGTQPIPGLGPIGAGTEGLPGFHLHSTLAVRWHLGARETGQWPGREAVEVLGFADQQYHVREPRPKGEKKRDSKARKQRARESQWWEQAGERSGPAPDGEEGEWIRVCDRGAEIYEMLMGCQELHHHFVIRAAQDRLVTAEEGRANVGQLFATARAQEPLNQFRLEWRTRPGQSARTAPMKISTVKVWVRSPQRPGKNAGAFPPIRGRVVRVWEENAREGSEALEWILLRGLEVKNFAQALEVALRYSTRWLIEEFHQALKSGTTAEELQ